MTRRPTWRSALVIISLAAVLGVYLFVQAPAPLAAATDDEAAGTIPIRTVFALLEHENDVARALWTADIVNAGRAHGLTFEEAWRDDGVHSGPLPALFLRETARHLERAAPGLRLFLGSAYPINTANRFTGDQSTYFAQLVQTGGKPQVFFEAATGLHTAMFPDLAVVEACVRCHNEHRESPKTDWKLHDIMGATTWMYPQDTVTTQRALEMIAALRHSFRAAYAAYLEKAATFPNPPEIGDGWPRDGRQLPSEDAFMRELAKRASTHTLYGLLDPDRAELIAEPVAAPVPAAPAPAAPVLASTVPLVPPPAMKAPATTAPATTTPPAPTATTPQASPPPEDVLVIRAKRSTRVAIDHNGVRLVVARLRSGAMTTVTSPPPLRVHLQDAESVALEYRGKPVSGRDDIEIVADEDESDGDR